MKIKFAIASSLVILAGCARHETFTDQAKPAVQRRVTNDVVGYSRTIQIDMTWPTGAEPTNWRAIATVEFVNKGGGIDRTNLPYVFGITTNGKLFARLDDLKLLGLK